MIAVVGGTGRLGRLVVQQLRRQGEQVLVVARRRPAPVDSTADCTDQGIRHVAADVRDVASLHAAMDGVSVCVSAVHGMAPSGDGSPTSVDWLGNRNLVDAAAVAGAAVVMLSVVGAGPDSPMELFRMKWRAEEHLRASGVPWTVVRATAFAELWAEILRSTASRSGRVQVFGRGENPINFVCVSDVATGVVHAVTDPALRGQVLTVTGPENLTFNEFAARLGEGPPPRHVPRAALRAMAVVARPVRPGLARSARTALVMDTTDMVVDTAPGHTPYPWLPSTKIG
ncbi:SDR family oxidoreductase [Pedococcus bigeumensis]|uniref:NAD-dependent epimerase/dehydratase family protein n=1 Tax=Pedococcus bigeumensis TaxID=433644 RepID=A0A502D1G2_9MICO|nr:NAD(P)H-binding protein [Pedococcus bigeumensis]TPG18219.1 NAD-dependent epimerase/dehydratase family protein [Pedococcus bigeumensis]